MRRYAHSKEQWGIFSTVVCPLNRGSVEQFVCDVSFPLLFNLALKVESTVTRVFVAILAICFDLITLPIRIIALPLVIAFSDPESPHALRSLIEQNSKQQVSDEVVTINYQTEEVQEDINGAEKSGSKKVVMGAVKVALKTIPFNQYERSEKTTKTTYVIDRGDWIRVGNFEGQNSDQSISL